MLITWRGSPNYSARSRRIDRIVIHWFGVGTLEGAHARFSSIANRVSAHYGISKGRVWQWVKEEHAAWHAGHSAMNHRSVGIEHDATKGGHDLAEGDYQLSGLLVSEIARRHSIPLDTAHIIPHSSIKPTLCPGTIDIDRIIEIARFHQEKA